MSRSGLKLAIIGCGGRARALLVACQQIKEKEPEKVEFTAMCDVVEDSAKRFAESARSVQGSMPRIYTKVEDMLAKEQFDAAIICTPHGDHHVSALSCLEKGVNVMIEKPYGVTIKAGKAINEEARRRGKIACVAENIRRAPGARTVYWIINENKMIGDPRLLYAQSIGWREPRISGWSWRADQMFGGGGMVMDSGYHFADTIRYLYGEPDTVYAKVLRLENRLLKKGDEVIPSFSEDTFLATMTFKSGFTCFWSVTTSAPGYAYSNAVHHFSKGCIIDRMNPTWSHFHPFWSGEGEAFGRQAALGRIPLEADVIVQDGVRKIVYPFSEIYGWFMNSLDKKQKEILFPLGSMDCIFIECYDFLDAVEKKRKPEVDGEEALKSQAICEAIFESGFIGEAVKVEDVLNGKIEEYQKPINEYWGL